MSFSIFFSVFLNLLLIFRSIKSKNIPLFIFFSAWFVIYTVTILLISDRFYNENIVSYFSHSFSRDSFYQAVTLVNITLVLFLFFSRFRLPRNMQLIKTNERLYFANVLIFLILFIVVSLFFVKKMGGIDSLLYASRPGLISGSMTFLIFFSSVKYLLIVSIISKCKAYNRYIIYVVFFISIIFISLLSKVYLLLVMINLIYFYWFYNLKVNKVNKVYKMIYYSVIVFLCILFLAILKFSDGSMMDIINNGLFNYIENKFGSVFDFLILYYEVGIESISTLSYFIEVNGFAFSPSFLIESLSAISLFLPSFARVYLIEFTEFVNSFSNIEAILPDILTQFFEGFNVLGVIFFSAIVILLLNLNIAKIFLSKNIFAIFIYLSLLTNTLLFVRGTLDTYIAFVFYDLISILFIYFVIKIRVVK